LDHHLKYLVGPSPLLDLLPLLDRRLADLLPLSGLLDQKRLYLSDLSAQTHWDLSPLLDLQL
jgi:hypothetical protein